MTWTTEKPTEPGWYWMRGGWSRDEAIVVFVEVYESSIGLDVQLRDGHYPVGPGMTEWAGPIPEPEEIPQSRS